MGWREYLAEHLLGYKPAPPPKPARLRWHPNDPMECLEHDARILLHAIYTSRPWARQGIVDAGIMSQPRWTEAYHFLMALSIIDRHREVIMSHAPNLTVAELLLRDGIVKRQAIRRSGKFVTPHRERGRR